jgi:hypothetical protein
VHAYLTIKILSTTVEFILVTSSAFTKDSTPSFLLPKFGRTLNRPQRIPRDQKVWFQANSKAEKISPKKAGITIATKWRMTTRRAKDGMGRETASNLFLKVAMRTKRGPLLDVNRFMTDLQRVRT